MSFSFCTIVGIGKAFNMLKLADYLEEEECSFSEAYVQTMFALDDTQIRVHHYIFKYFFRLQLLLFYN